MSYWFCLCAAGTLAREIYRRARIPSSDPAPQTREISNVRPLRAAVKASSCARRFLRSVAGFARERKARGCSKGHELWTLVPLTVRQLTPVFVVPDGPV